MSYKPVIDSSILSRQDISSEDGREFHILEISYPKFIFEPGQFVMIQRQTQGFQWSYPYMVYRKTEKGFLILSSHTSSLFTSMPGEKIVVWGANGKGCLVPESAIFIAEPSTIHLILPLIQPCQRPEIICIGNRNLYPEILLPQNAVYEQDTKLICEMLDKTSTAVFMALNISILESITRHADTDLKSRITLFAGTRIGCGIGACKSCYLHSPEINVGIPVCCEGPYLPCSVIDFDKDRKCFMTFR